MHLNKIYPILLLILVVIIATSIGSYNIRFIDISKVFANKLLFTNFNVEETLEVIVWKIRFPRVLLAMLVGGALAISGSITQSLFKNPLASPYTLGVSSGASLGVSIVIVTGISGVLGYFTMSIVAIIFSTATILLVLGLASKIDKNLSNMTVVLTGLVVSLFLNAIVTLIMALNKDGLERIVRFSMGSLSLRGWSYLYVMIPFFVIGVIVSLFFIKELDILTFGEDNAKSLGVNVRKTKIILIITASVLTGSAIAVSGVIGFIGLVTPHVVRRIFGPNHRNLLPYSVIGGGIFLIVADLIARTVITPSELPVGAITAFIGGPFFMYIFFWRKT